MTGLIVDGPFQRLTEKKGLLPLLTAWPTERASIHQALNMEMDDILNLLERCAAVKPGLILIADDLAWDAATYLDPAELMDRLGPWYARATSLVRSGGARPLFHSCGNISRLLSRLLALGFEGLAACQTSFLDPESLSFQNQKRPILVTGLDAELFQADPRDAIERERLLPRLAGLARAGRLVLASSCGLYHPDFVDRLRALYRLVDEALVWSGDPAAPTG